MFQDRGQRRQVKLAADSAAKSAQNRLVTLFFMLAMVLVMMQQAAQPRTWGWLWGMGSSGAGESSELSGTGRPLASDPIPDRFLSPLESPVPDESQFEADRADLSVDPQRLATIQDDTYFRQKEAPAWFYLYQRLQETPLEVVDAIGRDRQLSRLQIYRQTDSYRGQLVRLQGIVRRAFRVPAVENDLGIESHWQLWMFENREANDPIVVYALEMPPGFPEGIELEEDVWLTGYVYKRWSYPAKGGLMVAPVVLAKRAHWLPAASSNISSENVEWSDLGWTVAMVVLAAILIARILMRLSPLTVKRHRQKVTVDQAPVSFDFLSENEAEDKR
ncbi:MAG: hypothetical protein P8N76_14780 [Pirellulaceae bacterium]|nr:hypothetical protein [Pirellulaceae bacterium]